MSKSQVNFRLPDTLIAALKKRAELEELTTTELAIALMESGLRLPDSKTTEQRIASIEERIARQMAPIKGQLQELTQYRADYEVAQAGLLQVELKLMEQRIEKRIEAAIQERMCNLSEEVEFLKQHLITAAAAAAAAEVTSKPAGRDLSTEEEVAGSLDQGILTPEQASNLLMGISESITPRQALELLKPFLLEQSIGSLLEPMPEVQVNESKPLEEVVLPVEAGEPPVDQGILDQATLPALISELPIDQTTLQVNQGGRLLVALSELLAVEEAAIAGALEEETAAVKKEPLYNVQELPAESETPVDEPVTRKQLAALFGVSVSQIVTWEADGKLKQEGWQCISGNSRPRLYRALS